MNELHRLWFGYFVPSLYGNGPEDLISYLVMGGGVTLVGRWALREWRGHKVRLEHSIALGEHIIKHSPDIPDLPTP